MPAFPLGPFCGIAALSALLASACASAEPAPVRAATFVCADGNMFRVERLQGGVRLTTSAGRYLLRAARSSIGEKFVSDGVVFIQDGDFGALQGAAGGPFWQCHEAAETPMRDNGGNRDRVAAASLSLAAGVAL